jgi:hypothetical protein
MENVLAKYLRKPNTGGPFQLQAMENARMGVVEPGSI